MWSFKKTNPRRTQVRKSITTDRFLKMAWLFNSDVIISLLLVLLFFVTVTAVISFELIGQSQYSDIVPIAIIILLMSIAVGFYIYKFQGRLIKNHLRSLVLVGIFIILLAAAKVGVLLTGRFAWITGTAIAAAIILSISYEQRTAVGLSMFYCIFAGFISEPIMDIRLFLTMVAGAYVCCFSLKEIRTRMKLLEVSVVAAVVVFIVSICLHFWLRTLNVTDIFSNAGYHAAATFIVGLLIQSLLPFIEKNFRISTSMTLLDYSDANQPLLKRLAMEAPGTFSHSLFVGSIAESAAESIGRNGLLCRVGAYYHDVGKINKPGYFVENEMGLSSRHKELSPTMSQLIIVGHVKDGIEMAKEYGLPAVLRQFIETHHGTTLVEYFFNEAKKKQDQTKSTPSESEFRYTGPRPRTKEAAIVMLSDTVEGAVRSLSEVTPTKIETVVHNMAMKRLQDDQFDECDLSLRDLHQIEASISKTLAAHYHGRIAYPKAPDEPEEAPSHDCEHGEVKNDGNGN